MLEVRFVRQQDLVLLAVVHQHLCMVKLTKIWTGREMNQLFVHRRKMVRFLVWQLIREVTSDRLETFR